MSRAFESLGISDLASDHKDENALHEHLHKDSTNTTLAEQVVGLPWHSAE